MTKNPVSRNVFSLTSKTKKHPIHRSLRTFDQRRSVCPGDSDCYRRLREIPQQVARRQIVLIPREEPMKIRLVVALVGLAISFALPAFAQQKDTVDPQLIQKLYDTISKKWNEA